MQPNGKLEDSEEINNDEVIPEEERYEELLKVIPKISRKDINSKVHMDGVITTTLLLEAITKIQNSERRYQIVKLLIENGSDPNVHGLIPNGHGGGEDIDPLHEAMKIAYIFNNPKLLALFENISPEISANLNSLKLCYKALDLMLSYRELEDPEEIKKNQGYLFKDIPEVELVKRHQELLQIIPKILPQHINYIVSVRSKVGNFDSSTLLLQAITQIGNPERRREIVKLLLEKKADPRIQGVTFEYLQREVVIPLQKVEETADQELILLLEDALKIKI